MKLSNPTAIKFVSLLGSWLIQGWLATLNFRFAMDDPASLPGRLGRRGLYMFWHESLLLPAYTHARHGFAILVSTHRDGELIAQTVRMMRGQAIRGSSTRGGVAAVINMLRDRKARHLAITPDGPRGPRRVIQMGSVYLASRGKMPLIPLGYAVDKCWRVPSWDRMMLPKPGARARCVVGAPIEVPADATRDELEPHRIRVQAAMDDVQNRAERLAAGLDKQTKLLTLDEVRRGPE